MLKRRPHIQQRFVFQQTCLLFVSLLLFTMCDSPSQRQVSEAPISIFNGQDLSGWQGDFAFWRAENQQLIGSTEDNMPDGAIWLVTEKQFENFELTLQVKLLGDANRNSGIYYRGEWQDSSVVGYASVAGYEFDIGGWGVEDEEDEPNNWWGEMHDPYRRQELWIGPGKAVIQKTYRNSDWNDVKIRVEGNRIQHWLNGRKMVDWIEQNPEIGRKGFIGLQLHDESRFSVYFRNIKLLPLGK